LTYKLDKETKVGITTRLGDADGSCRDLEQKEGTAVLKYSFGERGDVVLEVKFTAKKSKA
jgi:hypothetical protein